MPIYMDVHIVPGVKAKNVAEAHYRDLMHQDEYGCKCMTYWIDEEKESIFCLVEAPDKKAVEDMHGKAHGLIPHKIIEVSPLVVESFLGRIYDPPDAKVTEQGLKIFTDPSFRILLVTKTTDPGLLQHQFGKEKSQELLQQQNNIIRKQILQFDGREAEQGGTGFVIAFTSAMDAVNCGLAIQKNIPATHAEISGLKMGINAGEPVSKSNELFGDTLQLAKQLCTLASSSRISISSCVKDLVSKDFLVNGKSNFLSLDKGDEQSFKQLYNILEENFHNPEFDIPEYCQAMTMSNSQLYRKSLSLTGLSPNILLKDFRLNKALEFLKKQHSISQVAFDAGFTSPSYFTKCFKNKYGLLPNAYIDSLH